MTKRQDAALPQVLTLCLEFSQNSKTLFISLCRFLQQFAREFMREFDELFRCFGDHCCFTEFRYPCHRVLHGNGPEQAQYRLPCHFMIRPFPFGNLTFQIVGVGFGANDGT